MATIKTLSLAVILTITSLFINQSANAQTGVPAEVASITQMNLEEGQEKLTGLGYEVCSSSLFGKKQDWFNESTQNCVTIKFNRKKVITEVLPNPLRMSENWMLPELCGKNITMDKCKHSQA
jgi:hypothetical protein